MANSYKATISPDGEDDDSSSVLDSVKDFITGLFKPFLLFAFIVWVIMEILFSGSKVYDAKSQDRDEILQETNGQIAFQDVDRTLVSRLAYMLDTMKAGSFELQGKNAKEFGACFIDTPAGSQQDTVTCTYLKLDSVNRYGIIRYEWGMNWVVQLDFRDDYACKSIETFGKRDSGFWMYIWNHTIRRVIGSHPRYLCERYAASDESAYSKQVIVHKWLGFLERFSKDYEPTGDQELVSAAIAEPTAYQPPMSPTAPQDSPEYQLEWLEGDWTEGGTVGPTAPSEDGETGYAPETGTGSPTGGGTGNPTGGVTWYGTTGAGYEVK